MKYNDWFLTRTVVILTSAFMSEPGSTETKKISPFKRKSQYEISYPLQYQIAKLMILQMYLK